MQRLVARVPPFDPSPTSTIDRSRRSRSRPNRFAVRPRSIQARILSSEIVEVPAAETVSSSSGAGFRVDASECSGAATFTAWSATLGLP